LRPNNVTRTTPITVDTPLPLEYLPRIVAADTESWVARAIEPMRKLPVTIPSLYSLAVLACIPLAFDYAGDVDTPWLLVLIVLTLPWSILSVVFMWALIHGAGLGFSPSCIWRSPLSTHLSRTACALLPRGRQKMIRPGRTPKGESMSMKRVSAPSAVLLSLLSCLTAQAQRPEATPRKAPCNHASTITRSNSGGAGKGDAWTTAASTRDGLLSLTYCGVFQSGPTFVSRVAAKGLSELPDGFGPHLKYGERVGEKVRVRDLPLGFTVYRDMAFEIRTEAIPNMKYLTFRLPSVRSEEEFNRLVVLYLDEGPLLPGALDWQPSYLELDIPKSDFKSRTLSAVFDFASVFHHATYIGRVVVASFDKAEYDKLPSLDLYVRSVVGPPYVKVGETFTYSVTVYNGGGNPIPATEAVLNSSMHGGSFVAASSSQGRCRKSVNTDADVVCELGTVAPASKVVVDITAKAEDNSMIDYYGEEVFHTSTIVTAREKDYVPENNSYRSLSTIIRR
jgi:hypothetical protein